MEGSGKEAVSLSIDADLVAEARKAGTNMSAVLERALMDDLKARRVEKWREDNREAIQSMNDYVEKHGLWADKYRVW